MRPTLRVSATLVALGVTAALTARTHTPPFRHPDGRLAKGAIADERRVTLGGGDGFSFGGTWDCDARLPMADGRPVLRGWFELHALSPVD
jgi:hypothetical protein